MNQTKLYIFLKFFQSLQPHATIECVRCWSQGTVYASSNVFSLGNYIRTRYGKQGYRKMYKERGRITIDSHPLIPSSLKFSPPPSSLLQRRFETVVNANTGALTITVEVASILLINPIRSMLFTSDSSSSKSVRMPCPKCGVV